jgi:hypothetical protein
VSTLLRFLLAPVVVVLLAGCQSAGASDVGSSSKSDDAVPPHVEVIVDIMSGVPNPTWSLTADDAAQVADIVGDLADQGTVTGPAVDLQLGFRGFVLHGLDLSSFGTYNEVRVLGDTVIVSGGAGDSTVLGDPDRLLYTVLRDSAKQHIDSTIFSQIPDDGVRGA